MKKDYSEYKHTDYEKYNIARQSNSYVYYDFFINFASFEPDSKLFSIKVDRVNEDLSMKDAIDEFEEGYNNVIRLGCKLYECFNFTCFSIMREIENFDETIYSNNDFKEV